MTPEHLNVRLTYDWQPEIRVLLIDAKKNEYHFPAVGIWLAEQGDSVFESNVLSRSQCRALWRWLGRIDRPPTKLWVMLNSEDVMRAFPAEPKQ